jgi:transcriptional regulator with XRE-family HTH domain
VAGGEGPCHAGPRAPILKRVNLKELGAFLKSRRDRIRPTDVGLPTGLRRRVPGLRRDEVAVLAGASTDYYTELERGAAQPSEQMLTALARALRLTGDERDHAFHLAGRAVPQPGRSPVQVHPALVDLLSRLTTVPAQIANDLQAVLMRNRLGVALLGPVAETAALEDSFVYRWFTESQVRLVYPSEDHDRHSQNLVADLRAATARRGRRDAESARLIAELNQCSPEFAELWNRRDVAVRRTETKRIVHPTLGIVEVNCLNLFSEDGRQRLTWFSPVAGTAAVEQFELLDVLDTHDLSL